MYESIVPSRYTANFGETIVPYGNMYMHTLELALLLLYSLSPPPSFLLGLQLYHFFGLLWIGNYILALGECTLAGAFASWYWAWRKPKVIPRCAQVVAEVIHSSKYNLYVQVSVYMCVFHYRMSLGLR